MGRTLLMLLLILPAASWGSAPVVGPSTFTESKTPVNGKLIHTSKSVTSIQCGISCSFLVSCDSFLFNSQNGNCLMIKSVESPETTFEATEQNSLMIKASPSDPPFSFPGGAAPSLYFNFENDCRVTYHGGATNSQGKIGRGVTTDGSGQYIDTGDISSLTCLVAPETCTSAGATVAFWYKLNSCDYGFLTAMSSTSTGFRFRCNAQPRGNIQVYTNDKDHICDWHDMPSGFGTWIHVILVYQGPGTDPGLVVFYNGVKRTTGCGSYTGSKSGTNNNVHIGKYATNSAYYSNVEVDELVFWQRMLNDQEASDLYNLY